MVWDERRVVNGDMGTGDEELGEYRSGRFSGLKTCFTSRISRLSFLERDFLIFAPQVYFWL